MSGGTLYRRLPKGNALQPCTCQQRSGALLAVPCRRTCKPIQRTRSPRPEAKTLGNGCNLSDCLMKTPTPLAANTIHRRRTTIHQRWITVHRRWTDVHRRWTENIFYITSILWSTLISFSFTNNSDCYLINGDSWPIAHFWGHSNDPWNCFIGHLAVSLFFFSIFLVGLLEKHYFCSAKPPME